MERKIGRPGDEVGSDDRGSVEGVVPVLGCAFPLADIALGRPAVDGLKIKEREMGTRPVGSLTRNRELTVNLE